MRTRTPARSAALLAATVFLLAGALGFVPGVTTHLGDLRFAGDRSGAELLGVFQVSVLLNVVHLLAGAAGVALAKDGAGSQRYLTVCGVVSLALWLLGLAAAGGWLPLNYGDNWLHFGLGVGMVAGGYVSRREPAP